MKVIIDFIVVCCLLCSVDWQKYAVYVFFTKLPPFNVFSIVGGGFFGQNVEIFIGNDVGGEHLGTLCAYGPTADHSEYVIHCFNGAMSGQQVTIKNSFTGTLKLCDVQVLGQY